MAGTQTRQQGGQSPLRIDRGTTVINDAVVVSIAGAVVKEISGTDPEIGGRSASIPGDNSPTVGEFFGKFTGGGGGSRGVSVEVVETQAAVDLTVKVHYGRSIPEAMKAIRNTVVQRVENLAGLEVTEVNINVKDVFFPEQQ